MRQPFVQPRLFVRTRPGIHIQTARRVDEVLELVGDGGEVEQRHFILRATVPVDRAGRIGGEQIEHLRFVRCGAGGQPVSGGLRIQVAREEEAADGVSRPRRRKGVHGAGVQQNDLAVAADIRGRPERGGVHREHERVEGGGDRGVLGVGVAAGGIVVVADDDRLRADGGYASRLRVGAAARHVGVHVQAQHVAYFGVGRRHGEGGAR